MNSRRRESNVWSNFNRVWPWHSERLEPAFDSGLPDVLIKDIRGAAGLVELKSPDDLILRPSQKAWIGRWQEKGSCAIPTVTCQTLSGKIKWQVYRYPSFGKRKDSVGMGRRVLVPALKKTGKDVWMTEDEMIQLVLVMNGLEPYTGDIPGE